MFQPVPLLRQACQNVPILFPSGSGAGQHHDIQARQISLVFPETFPDQAFDPVSGHGPPDLPFGYRQPQAGLVPLIGAGQDREISTADLAGLVKNVFERRGVWKTLLPGKAFADRFRNQTSGTEILAPLGATGTDDRATGAGPHPGTKTMVAFALEVAGLECSFHDSNRWFMAETATRSFAPDFNWKKGGNNTSEITGCQPNPGQ